MVVKEGMVGQIFGQIPNHPTPKFPSLSQFGKNDLHHNSATDRAMQSDWRKGPRISFYRDVVRKRIMEILKENYQWQQQASNFVAVLESHLFMESASQEEFLNRDTLKVQLQILIQGKMVDVNRRQQISNYPEPTCTTMSTLGLTQGCNLDLASPRFNLFNDSTLCNPMTADKIDQFSFQIGLLNNGDKPRDTNMCNTTPAGLRKVASERVFSTERGSTITTFSSGNETSDIGVFDHGLVFSQGNHAYIFKASPKEDLQGQHNANGKLNLVKSKGAGNNQELCAVAFPSTMTESLEFYNSTLQIPEHNPQITSQVCGISPNVDFCRMNSTLESLMQSGSQMFGQNQQQPHQPYGQFNKPSEDKTPSCLREINDVCCEIAGHVVPTYSQLPSEQTQWAQFASESSELFCSSKRTVRPANSSNPLQFHMEHRILLDYINHKSSGVHSGDCLVSFVNYLHASTCNNCTCFCERFCCLLSHFDNCQCSDCHICGPVLELCGTGKFHLNFKNEGNGVASVLNNTHLSGSGIFCSDDMLHPAKCLNPSSCHSENMLPSLKRHKMENPLCPSLSASGIASLLAPLVQSCNPGLPPLQQLPESPVSINSEVVEVNIEPLTNPLKNPMSDQSRNNAAENFPRLNALGMPAPPETIYFGSKEMDCRSASEITATLEDNSYQLRFDMMPVQPEELNDVSNEEVIQVKPNFDMANPVVETELYAPEAELEEMKRQSLKIKGVSLIEFFTPEQIKEHLSSLGQLVDQRISKIENRNSANENSCQLCAADKLLLAPMPIYCSFCGAHIKRGVIYYSTSEENTMRHCFCTSCYRLSRGGSITFGGITFPKEMLDKKKNYEETEEPWVQCDKCKQWQHQICALFNDKRDMEGKAEYTCPKCCLEEIETGKRVPFPKAVVYGAKDLPTTMLSDFIEQRLFRHLQKEREERAKVIGKNPNEVPGAEDLVVRVVSCINKQLIVKQQFLENFQGGNYPTEFPYRSKVILLFQKIEGIDVCLFAMCVQEFGSECSQPNQRCVYISYLDSVKYFRPETETAAGEALRTFVYHEILIGYLEYCKNQRFTTCYLWACPPLKGEDYILYCHPEIQKTPKSDKLRQWYHSMLRKASKENIVVNVTNLYDKFFVPTGQCHSKVSAARLPYFDGDYWSSAAENIIKQIEQQSGKHLGRKVKKVMTKRTLKAMGYKNPSDGATKDILLMLKLGQIISPVKEDFIVVHLQCVCMHCHEVISGWRWFCSQCKNFQFCERCHNAEQSLNGGDTHTLSNKEKHFLSKVMVDDVPSHTKDEDVLDNWLFENRHTFLGFCQKNNYQFDTLRRAKHSSMMILYHLHSPMVPTDRTTCNICHQDTDIKDGDVCATCHDKKFSSLRTSAANYGTETKDAEHLAVLQMELLDVLQHASQCHSTTDDPCLYPNCLLIKKLFHHVTKCTVRFSGGCLHCQKVWYSLKLHSRNCRQTECCVPRCQDLKKHAELLALQSETL